MSRDQKVTESAKSFSVFLRVLCGGKKIYPRGDGGIQRLAMGLTERAGFGRMAA